MNDKCWWNYNDDDGSSPLKISAKLKLELDYSYTSGMKETYFDPGYPPEIEFSAFCFEATDEHGNDIPLSKEMSIKIGDWFSSENQNNDSIIEKICQDVDNFVVD